MNRFCIVSLLLPGCLDAGFPGSFPERADVELDVPGQGDAAAAGERGEAYDLVAGAGSSVNGWVADIVDAIAPAVREVAEHRESSRDADWRQFGPFDDPEGRDLAWLVRARGDAAATDFEVFVGPAGSDAGELLVHGRVEVDGDDRNGELVLDMAVVDRNAALEGQAGVGVAYVGAIEVEFDRDASTSRQRVDVTFVDFGVDTLGDAPWSSSETYAFDRDDAGAGSFHLALAVDDEAFVGRDVERVELDAKWRDDLGGRARGLVLEVDNALPHGDLELDECFDGAGVLSFRELTQAYAAELPGYAFGDERTCVFAAEEL